MNAHSKKHIPNKLDNNNRHDDTRPARDKMAMGQRYLVWRLLFVVVLREQRAALRGTQLEAKCKTKIKMSKVLYNIGVRFPY